MINTPRQVKLYDKKIIISGNYVEKYTYERPFVSGFTANRPYITKRPARQKRSDNVTRAKFKLLRKVLSNSKSAKPLFFTLTYAENQDNRNQALSDTQKFFKELKVLYPNLKYTYVFEKQKRGAFHMHIVIYNRQFLSIRVVRQIWNDIVGGENRVNVKRTNDCKHIGFYLGKYLGKDVTDGNKRLYNSSKNLLTSEIITSYYRFASVQHTNNLEHDNAYFSPLGNFITVAIYYDEPEFRT